MKADALNHSFVAKNVAVFAYIFCCTDIWGWENERLSLRISASAQTDGKVNLVTRRRQARIPFSLNWKIHEP
jgi:hypothetical protein